MFMDKTKIVEKLKQGLIKPDDIKRPIADQG